MRYTMFNDVSMDGSKMNNNNIYKENNTNSNNNEKSSKGGNLVKIKNEIIMENAEEEGNIQYFKKSDEKKNKK